MYFEFRQKRIVYADFIASGKALHSIENYIKTNIQPFYANVHSESGYLAEHSENFRKEAKQIVRRCFNTDEKDSIIFVGQGTTVSIILNLK
jgi:selenocysteine lyase/cysteine desulfurase